MNKNPLTAFFLSFIPGAGHAYLGRSIRGLLYGGAFFGPLGLLLFIWMVGDLDGEIALILLACAFLSWSINMLDMIVSLVSGKAFAPSPGHLHSPEALTSYEQQRERSRVIVLSLIPGLGHMSIGLMQRGITFLISFVGLAAVIIFLSVVVNSGALLVFLLGLPVIWIYSIFDAAHCMSAKQRGESIDDRSLFQDLESQIGSGRKNKVLALALSIFPGLGHLYLGLQMRGLQLMAGFLLIIYIMDHFRLSLFFFLLPLLWCFAFFDALQQAGRYERGELSDEPVLSQFIRYQRWIGIALLTFGVLYLVDQLAAKVLAEYSNDLYSVYLEIKYMLPVAIVSFIMIAVGLRLIFGSKAGPEQGAPEMVLQAQDTSDMPNPTWPETPTQKGERTEERSE